MGAKENLVIVESPAKARTIEKILGKEFLVTSSMGHIRDPESKEFSIDVKNQYKPRSPGNRHMLVSHAEPTPRTSTPMLTPSISSREFKT